MWQSGARRGDRQISWISIDRARCDLQLSVSLSPPSLVISDVWITLRPSVPVDAVPVDAVGLWRACGGPYVRGMRLM